MASKVQRIELRQFYDANIHCPFCGAKVMLGRAEGDEAGSMIGTPCEHTLFIGHHVDLEYRSRLFNEHLGLTDEDDLHGENIDEITDRVTLADAIKIVCQPMPNSGAEAYVGFAIPGEE